MYRDPVERLALGGDVFAKNAVTHRLPLFIHVHEQFQPELWTLAFDRIDPRDVFESSLTRVETRAQALPVLLRMSCIQREPATA
jgi:hypothetical protein